MKSELAIPDSVPLSQNIASVSLPHGITMEEAQAIYSRMREIGDEQFQSAQRFGTI